MIFLYLYIYIYRYRYTLQAWGQIHEYLYFAVFNTFWSICTGVCSLNF